MNESAGSRSGLGAALLGGALLAAATPPAVVPGAEFVGLAGLALWFAVATRSPRPLRHSYLLGCVHMAWFAWSVHHVLWPAYAAIVVLGGLYFAFGTLAVRCVPATLAAPAFAVASAASFWLRAEMPEICFPHGQPCHALWQWPTLLASVRVGGEALANGLLGAVGATAVVAWRAWRLGRPVWRIGWLQFAAAAIAATVCTALGNLWRGAAGENGERLRIGVVEPGLHPFDAFAGMDGAQARRRHAELFEERWLQPTRELLDARPALVLWPESSVPRLLTPDDLRPSARAQDFGLSLGDTQLVYGVNLERDGRTTPIALQVARGGVLRGWHEKQRLVPGGEFVPFVGWLPRAAQDAVHDMFRRALGSAPNCAPGGFRAPLRTADDVPFGVLTCYDNAFPGPAREQVAAGARLLCVISNEAWYRGGGELTQLVAMTVVRALENAVPIVRCTMDGWSVVVGADGRLRDGLPLRPAPAGSAQKMLADVPVGPVAVAPVPWLRSASGPAAALLTGLALLAGFVSWARLLASRTAPQAAGGAGVRSPTKASGS